MKKVNDENTINVSHDLSENKKDTKKLLLIALKRHKIGLLVIIFMLIMSFSAAWFIHNTTVNLDNINVHVKKWSIKLNDEDDEYELVLDDLYPGMTDIEGQIAIENLGELDASIDLDVSSLILFGEEREDYEVSKEEDGNGIKYTIVGYPFEIVFLIENTTLKADGGTTNLTYSVTWNYESESCVDVVIDENGDKSKVSSEDEDSGLDCDAFDTEYGEASALFDEENPDSSSLILSITINAVQSNG